MSKNELEQQLTIQEVADKLGVTKPTVHQYIKLGRETRGREGIWPAYKISFKVVRIPASAVNRFLESRVA